MSTRIMDDPSDPATWPTAAVNAAGRLVPTAGTTITTTIGWLRPHSTHTLTLDVNATPADPTAAVVATIQGTPHLIPTAGNLWTNQYGDPAGPAFNNQDWYGTYPGSPPGPTPPIGASVLLARRDHFTRDVASVPLDPTHTFRIEYTAKRISGAAPLRAGWWLDQHGSSDPWIMTTTSVVADLGDGWTRQHADIAVPADTVTAWPYLVIGQRSELGTVWAVADMVWRDLTTTPTISAAGAVSGIVDAAMPVTVSLSNISAADVRVIVDTDDDVPTPALPCDVLALDVWAPVPTQAMRWDINRWDRALWQTAKPIAGALVWDQGPWDGSNWWDESQDAWWTPILGPASTVTTRRGMTTNGPVLKADSGTLTVTATAALDPRARGIVYGAPIRLYHWPTRTAIWRGSITDVTITPIKGGGYTVQLTAADDVALVAGITRYGARPDGGGLESWLDRLTRLMGSAPAMDVIVPDPTGGALCPTVWETSLAAHLDALVATSGGWWAGSRWGGLVVSAALPTTGPAATLTDTHTDQAGRVWYYTAGPSAWSSAKLTAAIKATSHTAAPDDKGEWRATDTSLTVTDTSTTTAWTGVTAPVDLLTPDETTTRAAAIRLLRRASTAPLLDSATLRPVSRRTTGTAQATDMAAASSLDPGDIMTATARDETGTVMVAAVTHTLTPTTWTTDLTLTPTGDLS